MHSTPAIGLGPSGVSSYPVRFTAPFGGMNDHPTKQGDTVTIALFPGHSSDTDFPKVIALKYLWD